MPQTRAEVFWQIPRHPGTDKMTNAREMPRGMDTFEIDFNITTIWNGANQHLPLFLQRRAWEQSWEYSMDLKEMLYTWQPPCMISI